MVSVDGRVWAPTREGRWAPERRAVVDLAFGLAHFCGTVAVGTIAAVLFLHALLALGGTHGG